MPGFESFLPGLSDISGAPSFGGGPAGPSNAGSTTSAMFDSSNWAVNVGSGSASGTPSIKNQYLIAGLIVAGLIAWKLYLKK